MLHAVRGAMGIRTPDLLNAIEALYQLSYDPETKIKVKHRPVPLAIWKDAGGSGGGAEVLDFQLEADALAVFVADEFEGDVPGGAGEVVARSVEVDGGEEIVASAHAEADVFFFQYIGSVHRGDGAGVEQRGGVAHAAGFEQREFFEVGVFEFGHVDARVEFKAGDQILRLQAASSGGGKLLAEIGEVLSGDAQSGGHVVSAERTEQFGAVAEGFDEGKSGDAAPAAVSIAPVVESYDNGGTMVFAAEA